jgi:hypothetical protein
MRNAYEILAEEPERKRPLGRPGRRWKENIRLDHREIGWDGVYRFHVAQDGDIVVKFRDP